MSLLYLYLRNQAKQKKKGKKETKKREEYWKWAEETYGVVRQGKGKYVTPDGMMYQSSADAINAIITERKSDEKTAELKADVNRREGRLKGLISETGDELTDLARRKSSRMGGLNARLAQGAFLNQGFDPAASTVVGGRIAANQARSLSDVLQSVRGQTKSQLAGVEAGGFGRDFTQAGLRLDSRNLSDRMQQFMMSQGMERDKIQAMFDMQPEWWETALQGTFSGIGQAAGTAAGTAMMA